MWRRSHQPDGTARVPERHSNGQSASSDPPGSNTSSGPKQPAVVDPSLEIEMAPWCPVSWTSYVKWQRHRSRKSSRRGCANTPRIAPLRQQVPPQFSVRPRSRYVVLRRLEDDFYRQKWQTATVHWPAYKANLMNAVTGVKRPIVSVGQTR